MKLSIKEIAQLFKTAYEGKEEITSVEFDSRQVIKGSLFIPLAGTRDGHEFIEQAKKNGAAAAFWSRPLSEAPQDLMIIPVADTLQALQELAVYYLKKVQPQIVAITGSNGKTTTKDMTEAVLAQKYKTYKTQGNYNNEIGLPYTILQMPEATEMLILEMGMDHFGEIEKLSHLAKPDAAGITMIGEAHIENLGSRAGIAKAKMEIVAGLKKDGLLLIPANEPLLKPLIKDLPQKIVTFGLEEGEISGQIEEETPQETLFSVDQKQYHLPVIGGYNVNNALLAIGFGRHYGLTDTEIALGLASFQLTKNRTQWLTAGNGASILSDVYNANPTAMELVLESFGKLALSGRKIAVLADMLELGPDSKVMHAAMADHITAAYSLVFLYGEDMKALAQALSNKEPAVPWRHFEKSEKEALIQAILTELQPEDSIFLKGSNGMGLAEVVEALQKM